MRAKIDRVLGTSLIVIMAAMVLNVLWQVFSRYAVGIPSSFTDELARYLMIWIGILGAAYASGKNMHVAIDLLPSRASDKNAKRIHTTIYLLIIAFAVLAMIIGGSRLVYISYILGQKSPALQIPLALVYTVIPLSGLLIVYYKCNDLKKLYNA